MSSACRASASGGALQRPGASSSRRQTMEVVLCQTPLAGPHQVLQYLARYTHRVAITNRRLLALQDGQVTFRWKDYQRGNRQRLMRLDAVEFLRRFLLHVLPRGFQRMRHFGFFANGRRKVQLPRCRELLGQVPVSPTERSPAVDAIVTASTPHPRSDVSRLPRGADAGLGNVVRPAHCAGRLASRARL